MTWSAPSVTKPPGASRTSEQQQLSPLPLPRNKHKQLVTSGNRGNPLRSGVTKLLSRIIYIPLRQNSGLYRLVHLTVRQAAVSPSRLEAPSSSSRLTQATPRAAAFLPPSPPPQAGSGGALLWEASHRLILPQEKVLRHVKSDTQTKWLQ